MGKVTRIKELIMIAAILGITCLIFTGKQVVSASTGSTNEKERVVEVMEDGSEKEIDYKAWKEKYLDPDEVIADSSKTVPESVQAQVFSSDTSGESARAKSSSLPKASSQKATSYKVTMNNKNGYAAIKGSLKSIRSQTGADFRYDSLYVDNYYVRSLGSATSINTSIDMKLYSVGYHCIRVYVALYDANGNFVQKYYDDWDYVPTYIYGTPSNSLGRYETYPKYLFFNTPASYSKDTSCSLYMDYRKKGTKKWKTRSMPYGNTTYQISGLKPNSKYQTRVYFAKKITYNGKSYVFSGNKAPVKRVSRITGFKTGPAKLPVQSVRVNTYNVKKHRIRHYGYYTGVYLYTETVYTYNLRATVTMKKKPGIKGLWINGKKIKGNKKRYSRKLGSYMAASRPRGTYTIQYYGYRNKKYGCYSKMYKKNVHYR